MKFFAVLPVLLAVAQASVQDAVNDLKLAVDTDIVKHAKRAFKKGRIDADYPLDRTRTTALMLCAEEGKLKVFKYLIEKAHASINKTDNFGYTALHFAAGPAGSLQGLKACLSVPGVDVNPIESQQGNVPLHFAACNGNVNKVMALIDAGASLDAVNQIGNTPLLAACTSGNVSVVEAMVLSGADHLHVNNYDKDALAIAVEYGHFDIVKYLLNLINPEKDKYNTSIIRALGFARSNPEMFQLVHEYFPGTISFIQPTGTAQSK